jgi:hypothetical protein
VTVDSFDAGVRRALTLDTLDFGDSALNPATGLFTVPTAGLYLVICSVAADGAANLDMGVSGTVVAYTAQRQPGAFSVQTIVSLAASQVVGCVLTNNSTGPLSVPATLAGYSANSTFIAIAQL